MHRLEFTGLWHISEEFSETPKPKPTFCLLSEMFNSIFRASKTKLQFALVAILLSLMSAGPCSAQCANNAATTPVTILDETTALPSSRALSAGSGTSINLLTPGRVAIDVIAPAAIIGVSNIPQKRVGTWAAITSAATAVTAVNITGPTVQGTGAANPGASGLLVKFTSATPSASVAGIHSTAFTDCRYQTSPIFASRIQTDVSLTNQRVWVGLEAGALSGSATPSFNCASFRFDTSASDSTWKCVSSNGTTNTITDSGITYAVSSTYDFVIDLSSPTQINFYINGVLVATQTTNLPTATIGLGPAATITTLTTAAAKLSVGQMRLESY